MAAPDRAARPAQSSVMLSSRRTLPAVPMNGFGATGTRPAPALGAVPLDAAIWTSGPD